MQPEGLQKSSEILDAILEAQKGCPAELWSARRNARGAQGEKKRGAKDHLGKNFRKKNLAKNQGLGQEALESNPARRPGWGGGSLRAFRWAVSIDVCGIACLVASRLVGWLVCGLDGVHMSARSQYFSRPLLIRYLVLVFFSRKSHPTHMPRLM